jgi:malonate transporter MadL subunit
MSTFCIHNGENKANQHSGRTFHGRFVDNRSGDARSEERSPMTVFGVALLAICTLIGVFIGDLLGVALNVKANVGGVGIAMMLLIAARVWLTRHGGLPSGIKLGVEFWATMYIPIVVAMAAQQNVVAAVRGGPMVVITALSSVALCFAAVAMIGRLGRDPKHEAEVEPEVERGGKVIAGVFQPGDPEHAIAVAREV